LRNPHELFLAAGTLFFRQGEVPNGVYVVRDGNASLIMKTESGAVLLRLEVLAGSLLGFQASSRTSATRFLPSLFPAPISDS
jgi:CRP-like cAMP-binding protein